MNELKTFKNPVFGELPCLIVEGVEYFGATEAARALSFSDPYKAIDNHVEQEDWMVHTVPTKGGYQKKKFVNESGLYSLIFGASKQGNNKEIQMKAKRFKRWVTSEVLPTIRKTGSYSNVPRSFSEALRLAADLEEEKMMLEQKVAEYEPKISYLDTILSSTDTVTTSQIAADYGMSAKALNKLLHELGVQHKVSGQWLLYRKHMNNGFTKSHTSEIQKANGGTKIVMNTRWSQKGRLFIYELLKDEGYYPQMDIEEIA